jgi:predicted unusual protein kinase regulating ubiquinone biosynthesis (AarF/ABC1/UbiB family)
MLSQDLLQASLQIPFSVPPYMSLLARAVATLEGIALAGDPNYQMVAQVNNTPNSQLSWSSVLAGHSVPCYIPCVTVLMVL